MSFGTGFLSQWSRHREDNHAIMTIRISTRKRRVNQHLVLISRRCRGSAGCSFPTTEGSVESTLQRLSGSVGPSMQRAGARVALSGEARIEVEGHRQRVCSLTDSGNGFDITCVVRDQLDGAREGVTDAFHAFSTFHYGNVSVPAWPCHVYRRDGRSLSGNVRASAAPSCGFKGIFLVATTPCSVSAIASRLSSNEVNESDTAVG